MCLWVKGCDVLTIFGKQEGNNANPDKVRGIKDLLEPKNVKDIRRLTGRMMTLTRFILKSADKAMPFFTLLRGNKKFEGGKEQSKAFLAVKEHLQAYQPLQDPRREIRCSYTYRPLLKWSRPSCSWIK